MKYFDENHNRLVYVKTKADSQFWEDHWIKYSSDSIYHNPPKHRFIRHITNTYLPIGSRILEGGCGVADKVRSLKLAGFECTGLDFTYHTLLKTKKHWPELSLISGDVRYLPFRDSSFEGYWSIGVIEHFYDGFDDILSEIKRILKPGGILFLTFPQLSWIRKKKAIKGDYPLFNDRNFDSDTFYQFALDPSQVIPIFEQHGFVLKKCTGIDSLKDLKDEIPCLNQTIKWMMKTFPRLSTILGVLLDKICLGRLGHSALIILQRQ